MRRFFDRQAKVVLAKLTGPKAARALTESKAGLDPDVIFNRVDWDRQLREDADGFITSVVTEYGEASAESLGVKFDLYDPQVTNLIHARVNQVVGVNDTTYRQIQKALSAGTEAGDGIPRIAKRIRRVFDGASRHRATTIARTEVISAANGAAHIVASGVPTVATKEWLSTADGRTRDTHAKANGQTVAMAATFVVGGASLRYPGDPDGAAAQVINCRCTLLYHSKAAAPTGTTPQASTPGYRGARRDRRGMTDLEFADDLRATFAEEPWFREGVDALERDLSDTTAQVRLRLGRDDNSNLDVAPDDRVLARLYRDQGFDDLPTVVDTADLDALVAEGDPLFIRGVVALDEATPAAQRALASRWQEDFRSGDYFAGKGAYGSGTYRAEVGAGVFDTEAYTVGWVEGNYATETGAIVRSTLARGARITTHADLDRQAYAFADFLDQRVLEAVASGNQRLAAEYAAVRHTLWTNEGRYAAARGWDAFRVELNGYLVELNRTASIVDRVDVAH